MDISDDGDIFMLSGEPATNIASSSNISVTEIDNDSNSRNPVKEHVLKQLSEVKERVERTKREIEETRSLKEKIMRKFTSRDLFGESPSSDSESELFTASGEPIVKRRRRRSFKRSRKEPLVVKGNWQHVTDDKWIVGVVLQNTIEEDLCELDLNVKIKDLDNLTGVSSFWTRDMRSFWRRTDLAGASGSSSEVAATVVLDLPKFTINKVTKIFGIVSYELEDQRKLQTLIPGIELKIENILNGDYELKFVSNENHPSDPSALDSTVQAILSAKSLAIEKITDFKLPQPLKNDDVKKIFANIGLREILPKVFTFDNSTVDRLSIVEIISSNSSTTITKLKTLIYARSVQHLNILLHTLRSVFPNGTCVACKNVTADDVIKAFETELNLYLTTGNNFQIQKSVVNSDFISKEFENGFTIYRA